MTFWDFAAQHPLLTIIYSMITIYGIETFIKAGRSGAKKKRLR